MTIAYDTGPGLYREEQRLRRAALITEVSQHIPRCFALSSEAELANARYSSLEITFEQKTAIFTVMYGLTQDEQIRRESVQHESYANVWLEGFILDPAMLIINERYLIGEISLEEKFKLIVGYYTNKTDHRARIDH